MLQLEKIPAVIQFSGFQPFFFLTSKILYLKDPLWKFSV